MTALIFDFDGVIADSEALANIVLAEEISALGRPTSYDDALDRYMGQRWHDLAALIAADIGACLPKGFAKKLMVNTLTRFRSDLTEVTGATAFIRRFATLPRCIASSSSMERLEVCLEVLNLSDLFTDRVFSADLVERGKPYPDIFLHAAQQLNARPEDCIVIEDSPSGVKAGIAAGMRVIGLCAGSHIRTGHGERLRAAGATHIAHNWDEVAAIVEQA
ncbi:HAD family hydrolase [Novosphingobium terrae]|uniref:HAD family hydrolase n=1 Tax=Novosphingobium terrae TaxID=2726189 RepID=UPI001980B0BD|nr:HAD-IA family hydrolase [Novosphingobium terrae]